MSPGGGDSVVVRVLPYYTRDAGWSFAKPANFPAKLGDVFDRKSPVFNCEGYSWHKMLPEGGIRLVAGGRDLNPRSRAAGL